MTEDHQTPAERRIIEQVGQTGREKTEALTKRLRTGFQPYETIALGGVKHDPRCLEAADHIEEMQAALDHQTERLRIAIERAEKAEAQREADDEAIKAAEVLADQLGKIAPHKKDGEPHNPVYPALYKALTAFRQALQVRAEKGGE